MDATMKDTNPIDTDPLLQLSEPQQQYVTPPLLAHFHCQFPKNYIESFRLYYMTNAIAATKANSFVLVSIFF